MSISGENSGLFDGEGYDTRLASQRFDSFPNFDEVDPVADDGGFVDQSVMNTPFPVYSAGEELGLNSDGFKVEFDGEGDEVGGDAVREWRRLNASRLAEKDKAEKDMRNETLWEAEEFKADFYKRRQMTVEKKKVVNREKQKIIIEKHEKFHKEAATNYWNAIAELVPKEVPALENRGKKDRDKKKPSITIIQGPKPGKPTDLSRMRQIISKLKHHTPPHLMPPPPSSRTPDASPDVHAPPSQAIAAV